MRIYGHLWGAAVVDADEDAAGSIVMRTIGAGYMLPG